MNWTGEQVDLVVCCILALPALVGLALAILFLVFIMPNRKDI